MTNNQLAPIPKIELDPDVWADHSQRIGFHESAHCVANYLFGRPTFNVEAHNRHGVTRVPSTNDVFADAVCTLAGEAFERSIGLERFGGRSDLERAEALLAAECSGAALDEACRVVEEAAISLASSERFHKLAFALAPVIARERYVGASQIRRILEEADPERERHAVERHDVGLPTEGPWYRVHRASGEVIYRGASQTEAYEIQRRTPGSQLIGSSI
jgi:hypothetical protein